jgi:hypothetical protein
MTMMRRFNSLESNLQSPAPVHVDPIMMRHLHTSQFASGYAGWPIRALVALAGAVGLLISNGLYAADDPGAQARTGPLRPNFAGAWEKDFARSDSWENELERTIDQLNREMQRQQGRGDGGGLGMNSPRRGAGNLIAHARLAELITRQNTLRILQSDDEIRIERRGDSALICTTHNNTLDTFVSVHGSEYCGWDRLQLVFQISLAEGVFIEHRFSVDPGGETLSMLTSVSSRNSIPFNLIQFFNRYDAPLDNVDCVQTLSRGQVCSARSAEGTPP